MARFRSLQSLALTAIVWSSVFALPGLGYADEVKLRASDLAEFDTFGTSVALRGDVALIGAPQVNFNLNGKVYIFRFDGSEWVEEQIISAADGSAGARFGISVALGAEDVAIIGASHDDETNANAGAAYVYCYNGLSWVLEQKLLDGAGGAQDEFGTSVAMDGNTAAVGAPRDNEPGVSDPGSISLFTRDGSACGSAWSGPWKLMPMDAAAGDQLGISVAISGTAVAGGAWWDDDGGSMSGSAYVFDGVTEPKFVADEPAAFDMFGGDVALRDNVLLVGMHGDNDPVAGADAGSAHVFRNSGGWAFEKKLKASDSEGNELFGFAVTLGDDVAVVGAPQDDPANQGSAFVYRFANGVWTEVIKLPALTPSPLEGGDEFGYDVSVDGGRVLVGARFDDQPINAGSAYVIDLPGPPKVPAVNVFGLTLLTFAMAIAGARFQMRTSRRKTS